MTGEKCIKLAATHTQWSPDELSKIAELAVRRPRRKELAELFPGRTIGAIRLKLSQKRKELGISQKSDIADYGPEIEPTMLDPDDPGLPDFYSPKFAARAVQANNAYLAALQRLAA